MLFDIESQYMCCLMAYNVIWKVYLYFFYRCMDKNQQVLTLKHFTIIKDLGTGSYGRVQLVKRKEDQKLYALKSVFLANAKQKEKTAALNEIRLLASIDMPYVVSYKCSFYVQEIQSLCIVMEYADGGDLQNKINDRMQRFGYNGFDEKFIWKTAYQLLKGLKELHQHNIIHRDIKCANIFFAGGIAKIGDLNISKIVDNGFASTQTGTPYYTSPQIWKHEKYDSKCDIWALGCIVYEMCTLLPPFRAEDYPGLFQAVILGQYEEIPKKYTKSLKTFIRQCLSVDPHTRPSASLLLQRSYFSQFELTTEEIISQMEQKKSVKIIQPIECPKVLRFLNQKLPKSKFVQSSKKTVCFAERDLEASSTSFKIKTKKIRSEKTIALNPDESHSKTPKQSKECLKPIPSFITNKSSKHLPPLQKEKEAVIKRPKSTKLLIIKDECRSMKTIGQKQNKRHLVR